jgi:hypothetical protein
MKTFNVLAVILAIPPIAWLPARFWIFCGEPWCLSVYPEWLDRYIYSKALPYLPEDMSLAAEQMEFIEVWIASVIIMEIVALVSIYKFKDKFKDFGLG